MKVVEYLFYNIFEAPSKILPKEMKCSMVNCRGRARYIVNNKRMTRWQKGYYKCQRHFDEIIDWITNNDPEANLVYKEIMYP